LNKRFLLMVLVLLALTVPMAAHAQTDAMTAADPNANISWPPVVYVLRGSFEVRGTANLANMTNYFLEFRPLNASLQPVGSDTDWFPAVLPSASAVQEDVLGVWDTTLVADGLYELRLSVNVSAGSPVVISVSPLRIENVPSPFAAVPTAFPTAFPTLAPVQVQPTVAVQPTATPDRGPIARITTPNGNVRQGDGLSFPIVLSLPQGTELSIIGVSTTGSRWYRVQAPNGQVGWMSPDIVETSGDLTGLPGVVPPPAPPTAIPTLIPATGVPLTPVPASSANLVAGIAALDPSVPNCNQTFTVGLDVANLGTTATTATGTISLTDVRIADGSTQGSTTGGFPIIQPNQTVRINMPLTISTFHSEGHRITMVIDPGNQVPESNRGDNTRVIEYTLQKASCP